MPAVALVSRKNHTYQYILFGAEFEYCGKTDLKKVYYDADELPDVSP